MSRPDPEMALVQLESGGRSKFVLGELQPAMNNDQTSLQEITERVRDRSDVLTVNMPMREWIDAHVWPVSRLARGLKEQ
jgi:hypothetical protein